MAIMFKHSSHKAQDFPSQGMQRPVHFKPVFLQLHLPLQPFLQEQWINSRDDMLASGRFVQKGFQFGGSVHPQSFGLGMCIQLTRVIHLSPTETTLVNCSFSMLK